MPILTQWSLWYAFARGLMLNLYDPIQKHTHDAVTSSGRCRGKNCSKIVHALQLALLDTIWTSGGFEISVNLRMLGLLKP